MKFGRIRSLLERERHEREMLDEFEHHLELQVERNVTRGMTPADARREAQRMFGHLEILKEACRDERPQAWLAEGLRDFRHGVRILLRHPLFFVVVALTLGLGIGATTAIFSVVNGVVFRPLPFPEPHRLVMIREIRLATSAGSPASANSFREWRLHAKAMQQGAIWVPAPFVLTGHGEPMRRFGYRVSEDYFALLEVPPLLGRTFTAADYAARRDDLVVLNYKLWSECFARDPSVIGRSLVLNGVTCTVIGVMPATFLREELTDPWLFRPLLLAPADHVLAASRSFTAVARLADGASLEQLNRELENVSADLAIRDPDAYEGWGAVAEPLLDAEVAGVRPVLFTLLGGVGFLLAIVCVNLTNLLLARTVSRRREISVRAALGAGRGRMVRQILAESLVLSVAGTLLGAAFAFGFRPAVLSLAPVGMPRAGEVAVDAAALSFCVALGLASTLVFGLAPAIAAARFAIAPEDPQLRASLGQDRRHGRWQWTLVTIEVALAFVISVHAGLLIRSGVFLDRVDLGYDVGKRVTYASSMLLNPAVYPAPKSTELSHRMLASVARVPGVEQAALTTSLPSLSAWNRQVIIEGRPPSGPDALIPANFYSVTPAYFDLLRIRRLQGRAFTPADNASAKPVAIVSDGFVRRYFPDGAALGKRIQLQPNPTWREIVGVVHAVREQGATGGATDQVYAPFEQVPMPYFDLLLRTDVPRPGLRPALREALDAIDPDLPLADLRHALDSAEQSRIERQRFALHIFTLFSIAALLLCAMGVHGLLAYTVSQRTSEFGVRLALGSSRRAIVELVVARTARMLGFGLMAGALIAIGTTWLLRPLLFEVSAVDPITFAGAMALLAGSALAGAVMPAWRATRIAPMSALRRE